MIIIKKISFLLAIVIIAAAFAGCSRKIDPSEASPFAIYRINDGVSFKIGDNIEDIEKVIDEAPDFRIEMEDETPEDQVYWREQYEYITLGYNRAGTVLSLRINDNTWQMANGLKVNDSVEDVKNKYTEDQMYTASGSKSMYVSYDEDGNVIDFDSKSPYLLRFVIEDYAVKAIVIEKNINPLF